MTDSLTGTEDLTQETFIWAHQGTANILGACRLQKNPLDGP